MKTILRSVSFNNDNDSDSTINEPPESTKTLYNRSFSMKGTQRPNLSSEDVENNLSLKPLTFMKEDDGYKIRRWKPLSQNDHVNEFLALISDGRYQAALKLQKVYRSFRTRRRLADCAVVVEQRWCLTLLNLKEVLYRSLKSRSKRLQFHAGLEQEQELLRWVKACQKMRKLGSWLCSTGLRQLILDIAMATICNSIIMLGSIVTVTNPFSIGRLDIGEGKEVNHERCPRYKLYQQSIKYLGPTEREAYEVVIEDSKLIYKQSGIVLDTKEGPPDTKWIFVLSVSRVMYVGMKKKGNFQHSSFLAGGATLSAGRIVVDDGILKAVWPHSGHYLPTEENFQAFMSFLRENNVDLTDVKKSPDEEDGEHHFKVKRMPSRIKEVEEEPCDFVDAETGESPNAKPKNHPELQTLTRFHAKYKDMVKDDQDDDEEEPETPSEEGYETAEETFIAEEEFAYPKSHLFDEDIEEYEKPVPKEKIMKRIDSHKGIKSYQLAERLHSRWSTGAGPRISCMRDYPSELQFRVLEQAQLSPRASSSSNPSPFAPVRSRGTSLGRSPFSQELERL
ncbi:hypothetical protein Bca101_046099 [Brassica carinata]